MEATERALLATTVGDAISAADGAAAIDTALTGLGWLEMLAAEPRVAIEIVFTALGTANGAATALDDVLVAALGMEPSHDRAVLLPRFGAWNPPGRVDLDRGDALGLTTSRALLAREIIVVVGGVGSGSELQMMRVPGSAAELHPVQGIDPDAGLHIARVEHGLESASPLDASAWESAVALGQRAVVHQISGACHTMLALARAHALERVQFGRPIAGFQAVRHRLADALVAIEALDATISAAGDEADTSTAPMTAALAKATAGRTARTVAAHIQQVLAGIGFTTDHPFHQYLKRTMLLDGLLGSANEIAVDVGRGLLAARRVPTLIEL